LAVAVGLPFFAVSATSPVLQAWFAATDHPAARNPYFLYAASNVGSLLALLSYPLLVERLLPLGVQSRIWAWGYGALVLLIAGGALVPPAARAVRAGGPADDRASAGRSGRGDAAPALAETAAAPITAARRARWVVLGAVPSSLMLSVTTYIS